MEEKSSRTPVTALTPSELYVAILSCYGVPAKAITTDLNVGIKTIEKYKQVVYRKTGVCYSLALLRWMFRNGHIKYEDWINPPKNLTAVVKHIKLDERCKIHTLK